jgi:hypothetical protein
MTQAFIDPTTSVQYVVSWKPATQYSPPTPVMATYPNSARVCQVVPDGETFPIAEPYFWTTCPSDVVADQWYYDTVNKTFNLIVNAPYPAASDQPATTGTQAA